jgi:hypothetical protein
VVVRILENGLLTHGGWFSPVTPVSSTTKTGRHDIAEILLKVALNTIKSINQSIKDVSEDERDYSTLKSKDVANIMHIKKM